MGMPNQPKTPQRSVRVPDGVWYKARTKALRRGESLSEVVRRALEKYAEEDEN